MTLPIFLKSMHNDQNSDNISTFSFFCDIFEETQTSSESPFPTWDSYTIICDNEQSFFSKLKNLPNILQKDNVDNLIRLRSSMSLKKSVCNPNSFLTDIVTYFMKEHKINFRHVKDIQMVCSNCEHKNLIISFESYPKQNQSFDFKSRLKDVFNIQNVKQNEYSYITLFIYIVLYNKEEQKRTNQLSNIMSRYICVANQPFYDDQKTHTINVLYCGIETPRIISNFSSAEEDIEDIANYVNNFFRRQTDEKKSEKVVVPPEKLSEVIKDVKTNVEKEICAICHESLVMSCCSTVIACRHTYHTKCIEKWLTEYKNTCPICRKSC